MTSGEPPVRPVRLRRRCRWGRAVDSWPVLLILAVVGTGCQEQSAPQATDAVGEIRAAREPPPPVTEEAWAAALREGADTAEVPPQFARAVRMVDTLGGTVHFDREGRLAAVDLARDRSSVGDEELDLLAAFPHLKRLRLAGSSLGNPQLHWIATRWHGLEELALHHTSIDDQGLAVVEQLGALEVLSLRAAAGLGDAGMEPIARLPRLNQLSLVENRITGEGLARLADARGLEVLDLRGCTQIRADDLACLAALPRLRVLRLSGPQIGDAALAELPRLDGLRSVTVEDAPITDEGLVHLAELPLEEVVLARCYRISDDGIERLAARLEGLQHLTLRDVPLRGTGMAPLRGRTALRTLRLNETFVDDAAMQHLEGAENLVRLEIRQAQVGDAGVEILGTLRGLEHLDLAENRIGDAGIAHLATLERLRVLDLSGNRNVTDQAVETLARMTALEELGVVRTAISDQGSARLREQLPHCRVVQY